MVVVRVTRQAVEGLSDSPPRVALHRQGISVAAEDAGSHVVRVSRQAVEALGKVPAKVALHRQGVSVAAEDAGSHPVQITRQAVEVLLGPPPKVALHRQGISVAAEDAGSPPVRISRQVIELLVRSVTAAPVPLADITGLDYFLHNWTQDVQMTTSYLTDVSFSPKTMAEERVGLWERPQRILDVKWTRQSKVEVERFITWLRKHTNQYMVMPLVQDLSLVTQNSLSGTNQLYVNMGTRRWVQGMRVLIMRNNRTFALNSDAIVRQVSGIGTNHLILGTTLPQNLLANEWVVCPLIDLDINPQHQFTWETDRVVDIEFAAQEFVGKSALPPTSVGNPDGWPVQLGLPVFELGYLTAPNWIGGLQTSYLREGQVVQSGLKSVFDPYGDRFRQVQDHNMLLNRTNWWKILNFFDSRRGRLRAFWEIDQEQLWTVTDTDPGFITVSPLNQFSDFDDTWLEDGVAAGIVMKNGTVYVRDVTTVQDLGGSWRFTLTGNPLPDPITLSNIQRFARARKKRFASDALTERWVNSLYCALNLQTIELLNEKDVDLGV